MFYLSWNQFKCSRKNETKKAAVENTNSGIGVVDMKEILAQSKAYQSLVDQFEDVKPEIHSLQEDIMRRRK